MAPLSCGTSTPTSTSASVPHYHPDSAMYAFPPFPSGDTSVVSSSLSFYLPPSSAALPWLSSATQVPSVRHYSSFSLPPRFLLARSPPLFLLVSIRRGDRSTLLGGCPARAKGFFFATPRCLTQRGAFPVHIDDYFRAFHASRILTLVSRAFGERKITSLASSPFHPSLARSRGGNRVRLNLRSTNDGSARPFINFSFSPSTGNCIFAG